MTANTTKKFFARNTIAIFLVFPALSSAAENLPKEIRFGDTGSTTIKSSGGRPTGIGLIALADHLGFFEEEFGKNGPKISQIHFAGTGPAQNEALAQGSLEFGTYGSVPNVVGLTGGIPAHVVLVRHSTGGGKYYVGVHKDSPIKTFPDLRGKRIAVQKGTNPYQSLVELLEFKGVAEKDVNLVNLQGSDALVAFNAGAVDAVSGSTNLLILQEKGQLRVLQGSEDFNRNAAGQSGGTLVSDKFAKAYPDVVRRVVKVLVKTSWWASEEKNREALVKFVSDRSLSYKYIAEDYKGSLNERYNPLIDAESITAYRDVVNFSLKHKIIRKSVDEATIRSWFWPQYQQAALKELKLEGYWGTAANAAKIPNTASKR